MVAFQFNVIWGALLAGTLVYCQGARNYWIVPDNAGPALDYSQNPLYRLGEMLTLEWVTVEDTYSIWLWQQSPGVAAAAQGNAIYRKIVGTTEQGRYVWTVDKQAFDLTEAHVFFLALGPEPGDMANATTSRYFNLTTSAASTASTSSMLTTVTLTTSILQSSAGSSTTSPPAASSSTTSGNSKIGMSNATKIGVGLGIGLGVPLVLILLWLGWKKFSKKAPAKRENTPTFSHHQEDKTRYGPHEIYSEPTTGYHSMRSELGGNGQKYTQLPVEMQGDNIGYETRK